MGKFITYISILVFIDIMFLITGQFALQSPTSVILNAIIDPTNIQTSTWWTVVIVAGIATIAATTAVSSGIIGTPVAVALFVGMATSLVLLAGDFLFIYSKLFQLNPVLATITFAPVLIIFIFTVAEWMRGKD